MIVINENYKLLQASYLFSDIAKRVKVYSEQNPTVEILRLGIGDVTQPLPTACREAMIKAVEELASADTFKGYGPEQGYEFLREAISKHDFHSRGILSIDKDDVFVSDGSKCDTGNIQELFSTSAKVAVTDPVYPVYVDTNVMAGRSASFSEGRYARLHYLECTTQNNFQPQIPKTSVDLIYLCSPNNPTGAVMSKELLTQWVAYAKTNKALILFDAAYAEFIQDTNLVRSIYEIPGAEEVAVEFRSFSKTAGFTGVRCAYIVVPKQCRAFDSSGKPVMVRELWNRRHSTKFNGVSYPVQRAAEAVYSPRGQEEVKTLVSYYMTNAKNIKQAISSLGYTCYGGDNAPYIWVDCKMDSWEYFDLLLKQAGVVCTPGVGFGKCGSGFARFSAFGSKEVTEKAMERLSKLKI
jgi:LL-diaminopimelate aminotransferase